jgi:hypothetical protein
MPLTSAQPPKIALGSPQGTGDFVCRVHPRFCGWGTAAPHLLTDGGDPTDMIASIRWKSWGGPVAIGYGLHWLPHPGGGIYRTPVRIELRVSNVGRCVPGGPLAYRRLIARQPDRPGGKVGTWELFGVPCG